MKRFCGWVAFFWSIFFSLLGCAGVDSTGSSGDGEIEDAGSGGASVDAGDPSDAASCAADCDIASDALTAQCASQGTPGHGYPGCCEFLPTGQPNKLGCTAAGLKIAPIWCCE